MYVYYMHELVRGDDDDDLGYICVCDVPTTNDIYVLLPTGNPDAVAHAKQLIMDKVAEGNVQDRFSLFFYSLFFLD